MAKKKVKRKTNWLRLRFEGLKLCFVGQPFDVWVRSKFEEWARCEGAEVVQDLSTDVDYLVVLDKGATAATRKKASSLNKKGASIAELSESDFQDRFVPQMDEVVDLIKAGGKAKERLHELCVRSGSYVRKPAFDLRGVNLRGVDVSEVKLSVAMLDGADLREADVSSAGTGLLRNVRMEKAHGDYFWPEGMFDCVCKGSELPHFRCDEVKECDFTNANLDSASFFYGSIEHTLFKRAKLTTSTFERAKLVAVDFTSADLSNSSFERSECRDTVFTKTKLCGTKFQLADLTNADLRNADLSGARLVGTNLTNANISGAKFHDAIVISSCLYGVDLSKAKGLKLHPTKPVKLGKASSELSSVLNQAEEISVEAKLQANEETVDIHLSKSEGELHSGYGFYFGEKHVRYSSTHPTCSDALTAIGEPWGHGELNFDSIKVTSVKSPTKGKALQKLVTDALAEAFNDEAPSEEQVKAKRKEANSSKSKIKQQLLEELRGGKKGIDKFNQRDIFELRHKKKIRLRKEDFSGAKLGGLVANGFDFQSCNFENASLRNVDLVDADLGKSIFREANLSSGKFGNAKLVDCDFSNANLKKADLSCSMLCRSNFDQADLTGANLDAANLEGAQLANAIIKNVNWEFSDFDEQTQFPKDFEIPSSFYFTGKGHDPRDSVSLPAELDDVQDFSTFMERLFATVDQTRLKKSLKMLKADRFQLFSEVTDDAFVGVVKSQTDASLVYSCRLAASGEFACCTQNLNPCGGLRGSLCKHLLVLIVGLTKGGKLDPSSAATWAHASLAQKPALDKDRMSEVLLKYKGAEAGEVDWRPMETIPEDYYTL